MNDAEAGDDSEILSQPSSKYYESQKMDGHFGRGKNRKRWAEIPWVFTRFRTGDGNGSQLETTKDL